MSYLDKRWKLIIAYFYAIIFSLSGFAVAEPIHEAAKEGDLAKVKSLIEEGSDVNAVDITGANPLNWADQAGHEEIVELLIKHGGHK